MPEIAPRPATDKVSAPRVNNGRSGDASEAQAAEHTRQRLRELPPEVGAVLVTVGLAGIMLPGPVGTPFLLAGGLVLAPQYFDRAEMWVQKRFPDVHRTGRRCLDRFIDDFERRYPGNPRQ